MEHFCKRCGYKTDRLNNLKAHLRRKTPCSDKNNSELSCEDLLKECERDNNKLPFYCENCGIKFKTRQGKHYHIHYACHSNLNIDAISTTRIQELEEEVARLKEALNHNSNTTINITQNNNITIVYDFGREDLLYIKENPEFLKECMRDIPTGLRKVVKKIYFDDDHPENRTVLMKNFKLNQLMVKEDGLWRQRHAHETIPKMVKKGRNILQEHYNANEGALLENLELDFDPKLEYFNDLNIPTTNAYKKAVSMVKSEIGNYNFRNVE